MMDFFKKLLGQRPKKDKRLFVDTLSVSYQFIHSMTNSWIVDDMISDILTLACDYKLSKEEIIKILQVALSR